MLTANNEPLEALQFTQWHSAVIVGNWAATTSTVMAPQLHAPRMDTLEVAMIVPIM